MSANIEKLTSILEEIEAKIADLKSTDDYSELIKKRTQIQRLLRGGIHDERTSSN
jgi:hypothetical protein